jgi:hypothetical protein
MTMYRAARFRCLTPALGLTLLGLTAGGCMPLSYTSATKDPAQVAVISPDMLDTSTASGDRLGLAMSHPKLKPATRSATAGVQQP